MPEVNKRSIETQTEPPEEATDQSSKAITNVENSIEHTYKRKSRVYTNENEVEDIEDIRERVNSMVLHEINE